jgi:ribosomal protein S27AE
MAANSLMICPQCGVAMNHHSDKLVQNSGSDAAHGDEGAVLQLHTCPECGSGAVRAA